MEAEGKLGGYSRQLVVSFARMAHIAKDISIKPYT